MKEKKKRSTRNMQYKIIFVSDVVEIENYTNNLGIIGSSLLVQSYRPFLPSSLPPSLLSSAPPQSLSWGSLVPSSQFWLIAHFPPGSPLPWGWGLLAARVVCRKDPGVLEECPGPPLSCVFLLSLAVKVEGWCSPP